MLMRYVEPCHRGPSACRPWLIKTSKKSVTLEEIDSAESLAANLERIELPDHLVAILVDPLMQNFMMLRPDKELKRASAWMDFQIAELLNGDADEDALANTLKVIYEYARSTKVGTSRCIPFARRLLISH